MHDYPLYVKIPPLNLTVAGSCYLASVSGGGILGIFLKTNMRAHKPVIDKLRSYLTALNELSPRAHTRLINFISGVSLKLPLGSLFPPLWKGQKKFLV